MPNNYRINVPESYSEQLDQERIYDWYKNLTETIKEDQNLPKAARVGISVYPMKCVTTVESYQADTEGYAITKLDTGMENLFGNSVTNVYAASLESMEDVMHVYISERSKFEVDNLTGAPSRTVEYVAYLYGDKHYFDLSQRFCRVMNSDTVDGCCSFLDDGEAREAWKPEDTLKVPEVWVKPEQAYVWLRDFKTFVTQNTKTSGAVNLKLSRDNTLTVTNLLYDRDAKMVIEGETTVTKSVVPFPADLVSGNVEELGVRSDTVSSYSRTNVLVPDVLFDDKFSAKVDGTPAGYSVTFGVDPDEVCCSIVRY